MTLAVTENPAVLNPHATLTPAQQDALNAIAFFATNRRARGRWNVGNKTFTIGTIDKLRQHGLLSSAGPQRVALTTAGQLAADKLKGY